MRLGHCSLDVLTPVISSNVGRLDCIICGSGGLHLCSPIRGRGSFSNPPSMCKSLYSFQSFLLSIIFFKVVKIKMKSCGSNSRLKKRSVSCVWMKWGQPRIQDPYLPYHIPSRIINPNNPFLKIITSHTPPTELC